MKLLKFLITGAPSSGKTTLLKSLSEIPGIYTIEEIARSIVAKQPELQERREFQNFLLKDIPLLSVIEVGLK